MDPLRTLSLSCSRENIESQFMKENHCQSTTTYWGNSKERGGIEMESNLFSVEQR